MKKQFEYRNRLPTTSEEKGRSYERLVAELSTLEMKLSELKTITDSLDGRTDKRQMASIIASAGCRVVDANLSLIFELDETKDKLVPMLPVPGIDVEDEESLNQAPLKELMQWGSPAVVNDWSHASERFKRAAALFEKYGEMISVPLALDGRLLGLLVFLGADSFSRRDPLHKGFSSTSKIFAEMLAKPLSFAIVDDRLTAQKSSIDGLQRELAHAVKISNLILPKESVRFDGYDVAFWHNRRERMSGDYFDFFKTKDRFFSVIADVMGNGIAAATFVPTLKSIINEIITVDEVKNPSSILERVDSKLEPLLNETNTLIAMQIASFSASEGAPAKIALSSAGNPGALLIDRKNGRASVLLTDDAMLGIPMPSKTKFNKIERKMAPGDVLIMYTDGITDVFSASWARYGAERLIEKASSAREKNSGEIAQEIASDASKWKGDDAFGDDATLLVIKRKDGD